MSKLGTFRAFYLVALCCVGSFLFAYDTGIIGGILTFQGFQEDFRYGPSQKANVGSNSTSLLQAGAFFSCFFIWPFTAKYGRRWSIILASIIFCAGAIVQTINTHSLAAFYVARVVSGVGVGMATVVIPMYSAEMAPKSIRGMLGSMFQFFFTMGVMTSYFVDYGVSKHVKSSTRQWQIPVGLQLVPGAILGLGMLLCKESTRWLARTGRREEALQSLIWVRGGDAPEVQEEFAEIIASIEEERNQKEGLTWRELIQPVNRYRIFLIIALQIGVQLTGNTSLAYYAPQVFAAVGAGQNNLLITGFFGLVKVVSCLFYLLFLVERIGRRGSLLGGAFLMGTYMLIIACLTATHPPKSVDQGLTSTAIASMTMIYLEAMSYNISWGPAPWVYMGEIFPSRIREAGIAIGTSTQWLFNFVFSQATPHAVQNLGWKTFLMFCIFNWALVVFVWFFIKETKGKSLEEMDALFSRTSIRNDTENSVEKHGDETEPKPVLGSIGEKLQ
ncbi:hypothetical protein CPAR01_12184 [Colletotrichum paranaense]|uniref:Major facilitator superfamily (MFS) profile domain-containing protein n=2 Tax=Colletotrichum acutatum species complex TaxID=2707335 RepID=A0ABQ9S995_9PEZI|nr:uncharacterized protein CPAR01_12184 [Colletotrichum paranaense]XP_060376782.1 uncharacterized protein CTAM01_12623 [Colletotrichum tamarilloi]KAK1485408.1 hypothetical protein CTAM01_12623 [Colletotrichum tamarilloi]KAK1529872.1 hypothetical protein CPAR01_12184 [Colletotrichum paranaense]